MDSMNSPIHELETDRVADSANTVGDDLKHVGGHIVDGVERTVDVVRDAADTVVDGVKGAAQTVGDKLEAGADRVRDAARDVKADAAAARDRAEIAARDATRSAEQRAREADARLSRVEADRIATDARDARVVLSDGTERRLTTPERERGLLSGVTHTIQDAASAVKNAFVGAEHKAEGAVRNASDNLRENLSGARDRVEIAAARTVDAARDARLRSDAIARDAAIDRRAVLPHERDFGDTVRDVKDTIVDVAKVAYDNVAGIAHSAEATARDAAADVKDATRTVARDARSELRDTRLSTHREVLASRADAGRLAEPDAETLAGTDASDGLAASGAALTRGVIAAATRDADRGVQRSGLDVENCTVPLAEGERLVDGRIVDAQDRVVRDVRVARDHVSDAATNARLRAGEMVADTERAAGGLLSGVTHTIQDAASAVKNAFVGAEHKAEGAVREVRSELRDARSELRDRADVAADRTAEAARDARIRAEAAEKRWAVGTVSDARATDERVATTEHRLATPERERGVLQSLGQTASDVASGISSRVSSAATGVKNALVDAEHKVEELAHDAKEGIKSTFAGARDRADDLKDRALATDSRVVREVDRDGRVVERDVLADREAADARWWSTEKGDNVVHRALPAESKERLHDTMTHGEVAAPAASMATESLTRAPATSTSSSLAAPSSKFEKSSTLPASASVKSDLPDKVSSAANAAFEKLQHAEEAAVQGVKDVTGAAAGAVRTAAIDAKETLEGAGRWIAGAAETAKDAIAQELDAFAHAAPADGVDVGTALEAAGAPLHSIRAHQPLNPIGVPAASTAAPVVRSLPAQQAPKADLNRVDLKAAPLPSKEADFKAPEMKAPVFTAAPLASKEIKAAEQKLAPHAGELKAPEQRFASKESDFKATSAAPKAEFEVKDGVKQAVKDIQTPVAEADARIKAAAARPDPASPAISA